MTGTLYRTKDNAVLGGVCQGLSDYLQLDVLWVRVFFFLLVLATGLGSGSFSPPETPAC
jgi:phage shock protein PspC (stress-responsive transcriptional regulator)